MKFSRATCLVAMISSVLFLSNVAFARWASPSEASYAVNFENVTVKVRKNGSYTMVFESETEILNERARQDRGLLRLTLGSELKKFNVISAKTINGKVTKLVAKNSIEMKPLASSGPGFDSATQVTVAFPDVQVGSKIYIKYRYDTDRPPLPDIFYWNHSFGFDQLVLKSNLQIESEIPLYFEVHDSEGIVQKKISNRSGSFALTKPFFKSVVEEESPSYDSKSLIWIGITSAKDLAAFPKSAIAAYENVISESLPLKLKAILAEAEALGDDISQINHITSKIAESVRYVGDWRQVKGTYYPRTLKEIIESGYGDCKDFTASTASVLKRLGFDVHAAWVYRGIDPLLSPLSLLAPYINHAIVYAKKSGREYWIDPTNTTSYAQGVYADISDRPAVVLFPSGVERKNIPSVKAESGTTKGDFKFDFSEQDQLRVDGTVTLLGNSAIPMTGAELSFTKSHLDYSFLGYVSDLSRVKSWTIEPYDLKSRIVKDLSVGMKFVERLSTVVTTAGQGYLIPRSVFAAMFAVRVDDRRVTGLKLNEPMKLIRQRKIFGKKFVFEKDIQCEGKSPWAEYTRSINQESEQINISESFTLKTPSIKFDELRKPEFEKFQTDLVKCLQDAVIVFD
jgi:transglutaminase-like putative cysteine protease